METLTDEALAVVIELADQLRDLDLHEPATCHCLKRVVSIANRVRTGDGKTCAHQNEDYPYIRCTRKPGHKGRHNDPSAGATW